MYSSGGSIPKIAEGFFEGRLNLRRAKLPLAAASRGIGEAAEFLAVGDLVGLDLQAVIAEHPSLDLLDGGGLTQHDVSPMVRPVERVGKQAAWLEQGRGSW